MSDLRDLQNSYTYHCEKYIHYYSYEIYQNLRESEGKERKKKERVLIVLLTVCLQEGNQATRLEGVCFSN